MKIFLILLLLAGFGLAWAQTNTPQTNAPAQKPLEQQVEINSDSGFFDGNARQMIYLGHVFVTDGVKTKLHCGQLTINLPPPPEEHPTNIVAETDVIADLLDEKGQTFHITAGKAVYAYSATHSVTNETITFTGGDPMPKIEHPQFSATGEPLVFDLIAKKVSGGGNLKTVFRHAASASEGTNGSPLNFLK